MNHIDRRRHYVLLLDTETANTQTGPKGQLDFSSALVYDCGWCIMDTRGNVYRERSFVNRDIFIEEKAMMQTAYYADKIPAYWEDIKAGTRKVSTTYGIRKAMLADMKEFGITEVVAHNARFDISALNSTIRYITKSKVRFWFPYNTIVWCTLMMSRSVVLKMPTYRKFCEKHGFLTKTGKLSATAEVLYRFISKDISFTEEHKGLDDVRIEREIMTYCFRQKKKMKKVLYGAKKGV